MRTFNEIAADYAPYYRAVEFQKGAEDYMDRKPRIENFCTGYAQQAYDRGAEAAMKFTRQYEAGQAFGRTRKGKVVALRELTQVLGGWQFYILNDAGRAVLCFVPDGTGEDD